jgi:hypothetical protein
MSDFKSYVYGAMGILIILMTFGCNSSEERRLQKSGELDQKLIEGYGEEKPVKQGVKLQPIQ